MITLKKIIRIADSAYPDGLVGKCVKSGYKECGGDTLALFVARELDDVYAETAYKNVGYQHFKEVKLTDKEKLNDAIRAMRVAVRELTAVKAALIKARKELK